MTTSQLFAENKVPRPVRNRPVLLEEVLCQIDAEDANFTLRAHLYQLVFQSHWLRTSRCRPE